MSASADMGTPLESYEPGYHTHEYTYGNECIDIGHEIGVHSQHNTSEQWNNFLLFLPIDEVPKTYGSEEHGPHQRGANIHLIFPLDGVASGMLMTRHAFRRTHFAKRV